MEGSETCAPLASDVSATVGSSGHVRYFRGWNQIACSSKTADDIEDSNAEYEVGSGLVHSAGSVVKEIGCWLNLLGEFD